MKGMLVFLGLVLGLTALAQAEVEELLTQGRYQEAYQQGQRLGSAEGLALAAKAASFYAVYQAKESERYEWFQKAEVAATGAIKKDPNYPEGYFERARAVGRLSQYKGILQALTEGLAPKVREDLEKTLKLNPKHAGAMVALALWHFEISQKGWLVAQMYGADAGQVEPLFKKVIALEPEVIIHRVEYAKVLASWGRREEARKQLEVALSLPAKTAADRYDQKRAQEELVKLR